MGSMLHSLEMPTRDSRLRDCYGESIDQSPDLTIYPAVPRRGIADDQHDALFFECKVLDKARGMDLYRANGIERFTGDAMHGECPTPAFWRMSSTNPSVRLRWL